MARKRSIHPSLWNDGDLNELGPAQRLLFIACFSLADDSGKGSADPRSLKQQVFPLDADVTHEQVGAMLAKIGERIRGFELYTVDDRRFYRLLHWERYQKMNYRTQSLIPDPQDNADSDGDQNTHSGSPDSELTQNLLSPESDQIKDSGSPASALDSKSSKEKSSEELCSEEKKEGACPEPPGSEPAAEEGKTEFTFAVKGEEGSIWVLPEDDLARFRDTYNASIDVFEELRLAQQWTWTNKAKRKTPGGMLRFLNSWLNRASKEKPSQRDSRLGPKPGGNDFGREPLPDAGGNQR